MISKEQKGSYENFFIFFAIIYPISLVLRFWMYANSKDNKLFLLERYFDIYEDKLVGILNDGTDSTIKIDHFIRILELQNIYLLYVSKYQFIFITKDSFKTKEDRTWFEQKIVSKIKK
ncbi:MAG: YcxB family protein [Flavobacterium sp.]